MQKLIALIIVATGLIIFKLVSLYFKYRKAKKANHGLSDLKVKGKKIVVQFQDCEIKTREYVDTEPSDSMPSQIEMLDSLYDRNRSHDGVKKVVSALIYKYTDSLGKKVEFRSEVIEMPIERLRFILESKMQTTIYVDENNWNRYYFDLGFLYN